MKMDIKNEKDPIVILDSEDEDKNNNVKPKKKENLKKIKCSNKHIVKTVSQDNKETLIITKKVKIKKQKIQCIINLPETLLDAKSQKCRKKHCKKGNTRRIVPECRRKKCVALATPCSRTTGKKTGQWKRRQKVERTRILLSPVSISSLEDNLDNNLSYDDISDGSFYSDVDLETLIKRTKDREKTSGESHESANSLFLVKNPKPLPDEDEITVYSKDMDISLHSLPTVVLEPNNDSFSLSPSPDYMADDDKVIKYEAFSPTMEPEDFNVQEEKKCNIMFPEDIHTLTSHYVNAIKQEDNDTCLMVKIEPHSP